MEDRQYNHKIEGLDTGSLPPVSCPPASTACPEYNIQRSAKELNLPNSDLQLLLDFKVDESDEPKKLENPDGEWYFDEASVPNGWKMKMYSYNSKLIKKVLEVFHYLTPDSLVLRGKKQVYDYMVKNNTYNSQDFEKFHFSKKEKLYSENQSSNGSKAKSYF